MEHIAESLLHILKNSTLITGLVIVMMMMIECINIESKGKLFLKFRKNRLGQIIAGAALGIIPGCMGGFATVSLYTHRIFGFGALIAMMIASSGDEAFIMLAMIPKEAIILFCILFIIAIISGYITDIIHERLHRKKCNKEEHHECEDGCNDGYVVHKKEHSEKKTWTIKRWVLITGVILFIIALASGLLGHEHGTHEHTGHIGHEHHHDFLSENWMNLIFAALSLVMLVVILFSSDHFIDEHIWKHIIKKHLASIFLWTSGALIGINILMQFIDITSWISNNTAAMIVLATLVGIIPESGPNMIFVTLFAQGVVPFPVLLANSISQDGHASIPLFAENKKSFVKSKLINCIIAVIAGFTAMLFF